MKFVKVVNGFLSQPWPVGSVVALWKWRHTSNLKSAQLESGNNMTYKIIKTSNGPLIQSGDNFYTISDHNDLFDITEQNPEFLQTLKAHILDGITEAVDNLKEGFKENMILPNSSVHSYINATHAYTMYVHQHWLPYERALLQAKAAQWPLNALSLNQQELLQTSLVYLEQCPTDTVNSNQK